MLDMLAMKLPAELEPYRIRVETGLKTMYEKTQGPAELLQAMAYSVFAGGKRIRPILLLASCDLFDHKLPDPVPAACALEWVHTYSLIHDDLPAMDNDDWRRGRPTSHKKFGEALGILTGDALLTEAFGYLARAYGKHPRIGLQLISELANAAGSAGMVGGQVLDVQDTDTKRTEEQLKHMHLLKTGALMEAAIKMGGILGSASDENLASLSEFGQRIGLAFQIADDILDVIGDLASLGKTAGKDQAQGKNTYVDLLGLEAARSHLHRLTNAAKDRLTTWETRASGLRSLVDLIAQSVQQEAGFVS
jgi:geranylgeranyl diphosphate synthase type II